MLSENRKLERKELAASARRHIPKTGADSWADGGFSAAACEKSGLERQSYGRPLSPTKGKPVSVREDFQAVKLGHGLT